MAEQYEQTEQQVYEEQQGFGLQMPQIGFQPMFQPQFAPMQAEVPQLGFQPMNFAFYAEPAAAAATPGAESSYSYLTRDAELTKKKSASKWCACFK
mmetsp:Transcript_7231/g.17528  ORF Transcript_7231/g.17528 Transcript_7231/m.17528 type:complete len:96 (+) Transcript_7231:103-390(+)|eukprot:CAMPEP_0179006988 /NCGR_PEP_ID=MMETSP0795-20121207/14890_1 /TAXON_ID=88552 /ORGANISM="Amoebophrya sp., Strain Ameob2" /LENGTH=95 /DNA_ID=CAMNT_0020701871 /DNA_START=89 /DNA_END=376 /DNA_ORIENTATION=+